MNAKERLIFALEVELDCANFNTEQSRDDSYQLFITKVEEICNLANDNSLSIHEIVETINIVNNLDLSLRKAYKEALKYLKTTTCEKRIIESKKVYVIQFAYCKEHYPFMIKTDRDGKEYLNTDYIWELSRCELKSMYFGYNNAEEKEQIRKAISEHRQYTIPRVRTSYDVSFNYNPESNRAFYSEEYKDCGNGHYYLALNHSTAVFCEDD